MHTLAISHNVVEAFFFNKLLYQLGLLHPWCSPILCTVHASSNWKPVSYQLGEDRNTGHNIQADSAHKRGLALCHACFVSGMAPPLVGTRLAGGGWRWQMLQGKVAGSLGWPLLCPTSLGLIRQQGKNQLNKMCGQVWGAVRDVSVFQKRMAYANKPYV
jgi:hypothetical protein